MNKYIGLIIVVCILMTITFKCGHNKGMLKAIELVDSIVEYDSTSVTEEYKIPEPIIIIKDSIIYTDIDTQAVIEDYFAVKEYDINERINDCIISFKPAVNKNKLFISSFTIKNARPTVINTYQPIRHKWSIPIEVGSIVTTSVDPYVAGGVTIDLSRNTDGRLKLNGAVEYYPTREENKTIGRVKLTYDLLRFKKR